MVLRNDELIDLDGLREEVKEIDKTAALSKSCSRRRRRKLTVVLKSKTSSICSETDLISPLRKFPC